VKRPQKKAKKSNSPAPTKKSTKKATKVKEEATAVDDDVEEKPKKKNYFAMMKSQEPPKALGTRPEPVGAPNCLDGFAFVISGQYETLTRDQTKDIIMRYGGYIFIFIFYFLTDIILT
jgi:replication factor C subunit 1